MKLFIAGATGRVGKKFIQYALSEGFEINALVRNPEKLTLNPSHSFPYTVGNILDKNAVEEAIKGCDLAVSTLSTDGGNVLSESMPILVEVMKKEGITRLLTIGTAGILESRTEPGLLRYQSSESKRKLTRAAEEHHKAFEILQESGLDWTIICPTYLPDGDVTGNYRVEENFLPEGGAKISTGDTAHFAFSLIKHARFIQSRVGIAY